jgi:hypothetical protein
MQSVMLGLVPSIHVGHYRSVIRLTLSDGPTWMAGTRPAMTALRWRFKVVGYFSRRALLKPAVSGARK